MTKSTKTTMQPGRCGGGIKGTERGNIFEQDDFITHLMMVKNRHIEFRPGVCLV